MKKERKNSQQYDQNRRRNIQQIIRLTEQEKRILNEKAAECKLSINEYVIQLIVKGYIIIQDLSALSELATEINKIGVNVNQIARQVNTNGYAEQADLQLMKQMLEQINHLMTQTIKGNISK